MKMVMKCITWMIFLVLLGHCSWWSNVRVVHAKALVKEGTSSSLPAHAPEEDFSMGASSSPGSPEDENEPSPAAPAESSVWQKVGKFFYAFFEWFMGLFGINIKASTEKPETSWLSRKMYGVSQSVVGEEFAKIFRIPLFPVVRWKFDKKNLKGGLVNFKKAELSTQQAWYYNYSASNLNDLNARRPDEVYLLDSSDLWNMMRTHFLSKVGDDSFEPPRMAISVQGFVQFASCAYSIIKYKGKYPNLDLKEGTEIPFRLRQTWPLSKGWLESSRGDLAVRETERTFRQIFNGRVHHLLGNYFSFESEKGLIQEAKRAEKDKTGEGFTLFLQRARTTNPGEKCNDSLNKLELLIEIDLQHPEQFDWVAEWKREMRQKWEKSEALR